MTRYQRGDIVLSGPMFKPGCFVITGVSQRPSNIYDAMGLPNRKLYRLSDAGIGMKVGTASEEFLTGQSVPIYGQSAPVENDVFLRGRRRAMREASLTHGTHLQASVRWTLLANAKPGDTLQIMHRSHLTNVTFHRVIEQGVKYVFLAAVQSGKVYKYPLSVLVVAGGGGTKRTTEEILEDLRSVDCLLSPENLTCDGERPRHEVIRAQSQLQRQRAELVRELGREPSLAELYPELQRVRS